jgi:hypothetical protein
VIFRRDIFTDRLVQFLPWIVALIFAAIVIYLLPNKLFFKYRLEVYSQTETNNSHNFFVDLDGDGISEWVEMSYNYISKAFPYLMVKSNIDPYFGHTLHHQINYTPTLLEATPPIFEDYDGDGIKEAFFFTSRNDSLFLLGIFPFISDGVFLEKFITNVSIKEETYDFVVYSAGLFDLNKDGFKEVVFKVIAGFAMDPRKFYAYDLRNDILNTSPTNYMAFMENTSSAHHDSLGWIFTSSNYAPGNAKSEALPNDFTDTLSWIFALNSKLQFLFDPIQTDTINTTVQLKLSQEGAENYIFALLIPKNNRFDHKLFKYDLNGSLLLEKVIDRKNYRNPRIKVVDSKLYFDYTKGNKRISANLEPDLSFSKPKEIHTIYSFICANLNNDSLNEIITWNSFDQEIVVYQPGFDDPAEIKIETKGKLEAADFSMLKLNNGQKLLAAQTEENLIFLEYLYNKYYYLKYPAWITIYLFFVFSLQFLLRYQRKNLLQKYERERKMTELELLTIKNQIDPHFIMNAVNTLGNVIFSNDKGKEKSYQFLVKLSSMIRDTLQNSRKLSVSLAEELNFAKNYLYLQQYRYNNSFSFEINNELPDIASVEVPKMIIQTFAENSVKHGLAHKKDGRGMLTVAIRRTNGSIRIEITDNGIGRQHAAKVSKGYTGKGLGIIDQIITLYNRLKKTNVSYEVVDLMEDGKPAGTRIVIRV